MADLPALQAAFWERGKRSWDGVSSEGDIDRNNTEFTLFNVTSSSAATLTSGAQTNYNARGAMLIGNVASFSGTTPFWTWYMQVRNPVDNTLYSNIPGSTFTMSASGGLVFTQYPGTTEGAGVNGGLSDIIPRNWRMLAVRGGADNVATYTLGGCYVL